MPLRTLLAALLWLTAGLSLPGAADSQGKIRGLLNNSPFGRSGANLGATAAVADPLEFRVVLEENGKKSFCIFDPAARHSCWVELNDSFNGFAVRAYDEANACVLVEYQGKQLTLPLTRAPKVKLALSTVPAGADRSSISESGNPAPIDPARQQLIDNELRRRHEIARAEYLKQPGLKPDSGQP